MENFFSLEHAIHQPATFLRLVDNYSARCISRIIFSSSFNITCTLFCKGTISLSISFRQSFKIFKIIKVQQTNPVTYLLENSREESIAGGFYEYELHSVANPDIHLVERCCARGGTRFT